MANGPGPAVDKEGRPVIDPTANVISILEAAVQRLDDVRAAELHRQDDLREAESIALRREAQLRSDYDEALREAESKRIDAIRAVDVGAVNRAAEVAATQAATLAAQVAQSAETLRNQVAAAATASTVALAAALEPIIKDIADLRRAQYEAQGQKTQVIDTRGQNNWLVGAIIAGMSLFIALVGVGFAIVIALAQ